MITKFENSSEVRRLESRSQREKSAIGNKVELLPVGN